MRFKRNYISFLLSGLLILGFALNVKAQQNIENITVTVTFDTEPATFSVIKAPLKYNKAFALSFQVDDGLEVLSSVVLPSFSEANYTDGCGNDIDFTASSSLYCFQSNGENGPDLHDPNDPSFDDNYLTWTRIKDLYNLNYGIFNHGLNGNEDRDIGFKNYSINRHRSYVRRKLYDITSGRVVSNAFVCPGNNEEWTQPAWDNDYKVVLNTKDGGPIGIEGGDVNNSVFDWSDNQFIKRLQPGNTINDVQDFADQLNNKSIDGANYWGSLFTHDFDNDGYPASVFADDFNMIAFRYGKSGVDNILVASDEEIYDYLYIRDAITVNKILNGNTLEITFDGSVPDDMRFYAMSLVIDTAGVQITNISVEGSNGFSKNINSGLVNFYWDDQIVPDPEVLAESHTLHAETTGEQYDAWIAMDYIHTLPLGDKKIELATRLCALEGLQYDEGFCDMTIGPVKIHGDTVYCLGDTVRLIATAGMDFYEWSDGQSTQTLTIVGLNENKDYWVKGTLNSNTTQDNVTVVINPIPNIISHSPTNITHNPGVNDTLWVSTEDASYTYLWNTGELDSSLIVDPIYSTDYYVDVSNAFECSARQDFKVIVDRTFQFTYDSVCYGETTHLLNTSSFPDSVISVLWDLNSDGVFDDAEGDIVNYEFPEFGNHLVGMRSILFEGGIEVVFEVVPVGDFPKVDFIVDNTCIPGQTAFEDQSTVIVGDNDFWQWDFDDGGTDVGSFVSHTYTNPINYNVKLLVTSTIGCKDSLIKIVSIGEKPEFDILNINGDILNEWDTTVINKNDSLYVTIENASSYDSIIWDNKVRNSIYYVKDEGEFYVVVYDKVCDRSKIGNVTINDNGGGEPTTNDIMNLFTPNGDGYNDAWVVSDPNLVSPFSVAVYNRYGNLVYSSDSYNNDWYGGYNDTDLPQATYYYVIEDADGKIFKGPITILR